MFSPWKEERKKERGREGRRGRQRGRKGKKEGKGGNGHYVRGSQLASLWGSFHKLYTYHNIKLYALNIYYYLLITPQ